MPAARQGGWHKVLTVGMAHSARAACWVGCGKHRRRCTIFGFGRLLRSHSPQLLSGVPSDGGIGRVLLPHDSMVGAGLVAMAVRSSEKRTRAFLSATTA